VTGGFSAFANVIPLTNPISASNPYGRAASLNYTFFDVGARTFDLTTDTFRLLAGLNGTTSGWDWQTAIGTSESKMKQATGNQVDGNQLRLFIDNGGYDFAAPTAAQTEKLRLKTVRNARSQLSFVDAKASTELTQLPAGPLGFAIGIEARKEKLVDTPDPIVAQGRLLGTGSSITKGARTASAGFFEFSIPALKNLEFQVAGRADHYDDVGSAFSPKVSGKWTPTKEMLVRASYARGFRAPTLVENAASASLGFANVTDPLRANASTLIGSLNVGSTALKAEKSESLNLGFVIEPASWSSFGVDYYNITQKNLVSLRGAQFIVNNASLFPGAVVRDPATNFIQIVYDSYSNLAEVATQGLDFDARLKMPSAGYGNFIVRANASHLLSWRQAPRLGDAAIEYAGRNAAPNGQAFPRNRAKLALDWTMAGMTATVSGNYTARYNQKGSVSALAAPTIGEHKTVDIYAAYTGIKNWKFVASVTNLFNTNPPIDLSTGVGPETTLYDLRSRYYRLGVEYKF
jgi:iron complex outermembrane recepter protein